MTPGQNRFKGAALILGLIVLVVWILRREDLPTPPPSAVEKVPAAEEAPPLPAIETLSIATELAATLSNPEGSPEEELQAVAQILYVYRQGFGENPVGQNEDVVAALLGANEKRTAYLPADNPLIVGGKLVDRWGSPYWFHPVSGREMEIRSAGPDRELFTGDDLSTP